jgi:hypothetical protein
MQIMSKAILHTYIKPLGLVLALVLAFLCAGLAADIAVARQVQADYSQDTYTGSDVQSAPETQSSQGMGWSKLPQWLQIILTIGLALMIYYIIQALLKSRSSREETVVHPGSSGVGSSTVILEQGERVVKRTDLPENRPSSGYQVPQGNPPTTQRKTQQAKKGGSWALIIFGIVLFNIIRQCVQNK